MPAPTQACPGIAPAQGFARTAALPRRALGLLLALTACLVAPAAQAAQPTGYLGVEEAAILPEGASVASLGLLPTVGIGHGVNLGLARHLHGGELRAHLGAFGRAQALEGVVGGLGWKQPLGHWGPWSLAALGEFSAGQSAFVNTPRQVLGLLAFAGTMPLGPVVLTLGPRVVLLDQGLGSTLTSVGPLASVAFGPQVGLRWPIGAGFSLLGVAASAWHTKLGPLPLSAARLGLRWAPSPGFTWELGAGMDLAGTATGLGQQEHQGLVATTLSFGF